MVKCSIEHDGEGYSSSCPLKVMRYHSLIGERASLPEAHKNAWTSDQLIMAIQHQTRPLYGLRFIPKVWGSDGDFLIRNFLTNEELPYRDQCSISEQRP